MSKQKIKLKVGDIIVNEKGWLRKIIAVHPTPENVHITYQYDIVNEKNDGEGEWRGFCQCSQKHMLAWGKLRENYGE